MTWSITPAWLPYIAVKSSDPAPVHFAAGELKTYLQRILGGRLPAAPAAKTPVIELAVNPELAGGDEAFEFTRSGSTLRLTGGGPLGVVFGVFEFLRRYGGCQFSGLPPDGEDIPRLKRIEISETHRRQTPKLWYRGFQFYHADLPLSVKRLDWMVRNGMNYVMVSPIPDLEESWEARVIDPGTGRPLGSIRQGRYTFKWFRAKFLPEITKRGLKVDMNHHNLFTWLPPEKYFKPHPEWFPLLNGRRTAVPSQLCICTTNKDAVAEVTANIRQFLRANPEVSIVGLIPEDGVGMCQCDACRATDYDPGDALRDTRITDSGAHKSPEAERKSKIRRYARFANEVARALRPEFPQVRLGTAAYYDIQWPPRDVVLEDNIVPWVAIYWRCGAHRLAPDGCQVNRFFFDILQQWRGVHKGKLILYEYYMGMGSQYSLPYPIAEVLCREWPGLKALGLDGATVQSADSCHEPYALNYLAFARSAWQDRVGYKKLLNDYLRGMFGSAAAAIKPIFAELQRQLQRVEQGSVSTPYLDAAWGGIGCFQPNGKNFLYTTARKGLAWFFEQIAAAEKMAATEREQRQVARLKRAWQYWEKIAGFLETEVRIHQAFKAGDQTQAARLAAEAFLKYENAADEFKALESDDGWFFSFRHELKSALGGFRQKSDLATLSRAGKLVLEIRFREDSYVRANADGIQEGGQILPAGRPPFIRVANRELMLEVDNRPGLDIRINGQALTDQTPKKARIRVWRKAGGASQPPQWTVEAG